MASSRMHTENADMIVCLGEAHIHFMPFVSAQATQSVQLPISSSANVFRIIQKHEGKATFMGTVGFDDFAKVLHDIFVQDRQHGKIIMQKADCEAETAIVFSTHSQIELPLISSLYADMLLNQSKLDFDLIKKASIFHYGSVTIISEPCRSAHLNAIEVAKGNGAFLSYNPKFINKRHLWPSSAEARTSILSIWETAHLIRVNEDEVFFLTNGGNPEDDDLVMRELWGTSLRLLLVTQGPKGCKYFSKKFRGRVVSTKVEAIDNTGAGDAFVGAFLTKLAGDMSLLEDEGKMRSALKFANLCGAATTTKNDFLLRNDGTADV